MSNFVNVVGFQLEKVHTGVIKWCLESEYNISFSDSKYNTLSALYNHLGKDIPFEQGDVIEVKCTPEYSFGRKVRIDLFIKITTDVSKYYIVCEMKVDTDPYVKQLNQIVEVVEQKFNVKNNTEYLLILIGASTVQRSIGDSHAIFKVITLEDLIDIFSCSRSESYIVSDWLNSLFSECGRRNNIINNFIRLYSLGIGKKDQHIKMGYRPFFSTYYYLYSEMRKHSIVPDSWKIYSGGNNPVMNYKDGWRNVGDFRFYWEFNYLEFCFKVSINKDKVSSSKLNELRDVMYPILESIPCNGRRTQKRYGNWNSIFKWEFDLSKTSSANIFKEIELSILPAYDDLCSVAKNV